MAQWDATVSWLVEGTVHAASACFSSFLARETAPAFSWGGAGHHESAGQRPKTAFWQYPCLCLGIGASQSPCWPSRPRSITCRAAPWAHTGISATDGSRLRLSQG